MNLAHRIATVAGKLLGGVRSGPERLAIRKLDPGRSIAVTAVGFTDGGAMPDQHAGTHPRPPSLMWTDMPAGTAELVILCEDPDAPLPKPFAHWVVYGIPAGATTYPFDSVSGSLAPTPGKAGKNSKRTLGFAGAAPPPGHGVHHYNFQVFALDRQLSLEPGADRDTVVAAMKGHVLASGEVVGTYEAH